MTCEEGTCGTGGWSGPKPGDPSNNSVLTATPAFGGIDVRWTFPTTNPFAVAHTRVFRGIIADFDAAIVVADPVGGSFYYDKVLPPTEYFYWIQFVSINGTYGEVIGPASAVARDSIQETIEQLTARIDAGMLANALKTEIARIPEIDNRIIGEIEDRLASNIALSNALALVQGVSDETLIVVQQEITQRQDAVSALVQSINSLFVQAGGNAAAIVEEKNIRVSKDDALAQRIDTLVAGVGGDINAAIVEEQTVRANADAALASDVTTLFTNYSGVTAAIIQEATTRASEDGARSTLITDLYTKHGQNVAAIENEQTTRSNADSALAQDISTLYVQSGVNHAAILTTNQALVDQASATTSAITTMRSTVAGDTAITVGNAIAGEAAARNTAISAAVQTESSTRVDQYNALAQQITTVEASMGDDLVQAQTNLAVAITTVDGRVTTLNGDLTGFGGRVSVTEGAIVTANSAISTANNNITTVTNKANALGALYTAKVTVNTLIGGFGIYNSGVEVEAGFDVDTFWVGRTSANKRKPFIIVDDETFIDQAVINQLTFSKLRDESGSLIVENGKVKAAYLEVDSLVAHNIDVVGTTGKININNHSMSYGQSSYNNGSGFWIGQSGDVALFSIGNSSGHNMRWDGSNLIVDGDIINTSNLVTDSVSSVDFFGSVTSTPTGFTLAVASKVLITLTANIVYDVFDNQTPAGFVVDGPSGRVITNANNGPISAFFSGPAGYYTITARNGISYTAGLSDVAIVKFKK